MFVLPIELKYQKMRQHKQLKQLKQNYKLSANRWGMYISQTNHGEGEYNVGEYSSYKEAKGFDHNFDCDIHRLCSAGC